MMAAHSIAPVRLTRSSGDVEPGSCSAGAREWMVARINMSHGDHADTPAGWDKCSTRAEGGLSVAFLMDLPGPKFRVGSSRRLDRVARGVFESACRARRGGPIAFRAASRAARCAASEVSYISRTAPLKLCVKARLRGSRGLRCHLRRTVSPGSGINVPDSALGGLIPPA